MKYAWLVPALMLDLIQFLLGITFVALQFAGGALGTLVAGFVGTALSSSISAVGVAVSVALSVSVGGALVLGLAMNGMFYPRIILGRLMGEVLPVLNLLPIWTSMVWRCVKEHEKQTGGMQAGTLSEAWSFIRDEEGEASPLRSAAQTFAARRMEPPTPVPSTTPTDTSKQRTPFVSRFADIKPAAKGAALALMLALAPALHAQVVPPPIQYVVSPETPGAKELVRIEAQGVGSFLGDADITWTQDGAVVKKGIGERSYTFTTGALGKRTTVRVDIDSSQGYFTKTFTFTPSRINLVWEADTTIPPLYKGKALYSGGSSYKVVAYPSVFSGSSRVAASALSYQWTYKGEAVPEASGLGRTIFTHTGDQLQASEEVAVDVYYGSTKVGRASISIAATDPMVALYQRDPLRGVIYEQALPASGISLVAKEITVQAEPFYFSTATKKAGLIPFSWMLNDAETSGPDSARGIITLRQGGSGQGAATLSVSLQNNNPDQLVQAARASLPIEFGASQSGGILDFLGL